MRNIYTWELNFLKLFAGLDVTRMSGQAPQPQPQRFVRGQT